MVTNTSTGLLSCSLSQASTPGSDQSPPPRSIMPSLSVPDSSYRGPGNLWSSIKKKKKKLGQPGDLSFFECRGRTEKGRGAERKINLQSSGTSQSLSLCTGGPMPHSKMHGPLSLPRLQGPLRGTAAWPLPTSGH